MTIPHVFVKKLQLCDWLIVPPIEETAATISIACFTKHSMTDRATLEIELELVNIDVALGQAVQHRNPISEARGKEGKLLAIQEELPHQQKED